MIMIIIIITMIIIILSRDLIYYICVDVISYLAGEVLDIDGITGGYNFQSAWSTGYIAGNNCGSSLL